MLSLSAMVCGDLHSVVRPNSKKSSSASPRVRFVELLLFQPLFEHELAMDLGALVLPDKVFAGGTLATQFSEAAALRHRRRRNAHDRRLAERSAVVAHVAAL